MGDARAIQLAAIAVIAAVLAGCWPSEPAPYRREFTAFATSIRIEIRGQSAGSAAAAADAIEAFFHGVDRDWYAWGGGELSRVNAALQKGDPIDLSPDLQPLIASAIELHARSGGLFDPAIGGLVALWQFNDAEAHAGGAAGVPPRAIDVEALRARQGTTADLELRGQRLRSRLPVILDLGGLAKGSALERVRCLLADHEVADALVDVGGSSQLAIGTHGSRPWKIGLRDPRSNAIVARLTMRPGEAAASSGDYERYFLKDGERYGHVLDPRTGAPARESAAVTVLAADAELADAAATALMAGGPREFASVADRLGVRDALMITVRGELLLTPGMRQRLLASNDARLPVLAWASGP